MSGKEVLENGILIATFMGNKMNGENWISGYDARFPTLDLVSPSEVYYDECWNWIMPVVCEIESMGHFSCIEKISLAEHRCCFSNTELGGERAETKIEAIYKACLQFINWHNNKNNENTIDVVSGIVNKKLNLE